MPHVLAIGEALIDALSAESVNSLKDARDFRMQPGGSPANFCSYLQQIGVTTTLVAAVGSDGFGEMLLQAMQQQGVSTQQVRQLEGRCTSLIMVGRSAETPDFLPYRDADRYLQPVDESLIAGADLVHTTAFALSRKPARSVILNALENAAATGKLVSIDWNYSGKIWRKHKKAKAVFETVCAFNPLLKCSLDDIERFLEKSTSVDEAKVFLQTLPVRAVCLTCGKEGVWQKYGASNWTHHAATPVVVKDATGAGDSFWAGFVAAYLQGNDIESCVTNGVKTAARKLQGLPLL